MHTVTLDGQLTFADISLAIQGEEALGFKFVDCKPLDSPVLHNEIQFEEHLTLPLPALCQVLPEAAPPPGGMAEEWSGEFASEGETKKAKLYR